MLRKIRNDFAHSEKKESLDDSRHKNRVREIVKEMQKASAWKNMYPAVCAGIKTQTLADLSTALAVMIILLEIASHLNQRISFTYPISLDARGDQEDLKKGTMGVPTEA